MVFRKFLFRRKRTIPKRKRRFFRRRRPGMGAYAKRFFKLKRVISIVHSANQPYWERVNDNPSNSQDWVNVSNLFQMYRVNGIKLTFVPSSNSNALNSGTNLAFQPIYMFLDTNNTVSAIPSENDVMQYENLKIRQMSKMWSIYFKMTRRLNPTATQSISPDGYSSVTNPTSTQSINILNPNVSTTALGSLGKLIVTYYVSAKVRN